MEYEKPNTACSDRRWNRRPASQQDLQLLAHIEKNLYTAVISDTLDDIGLRDQAMRKDFRPLSPTFRLAGWARTIKCVDVFEIPEDTYAMEIEAVDMPAARGSSMRINGRLRT